MQKLNAGFSIIFYELKFEQLADNNLYTNTVQVLSTGNYNRIDESSPESRLNSSTISLTISETGLI